MREEQQRIWSNHTELADARTLYAAWFGRKSGAVVKSVVIHGLTTKCHQCQAQCLFQPCHCKQEGCHGHKERGYAQCEGVVCPRCLAKQYNAAEIDTLASADYICPPCRGICNCVNHLCRRSQRARPRWQMHDLILLSLGHAACLGCPLCPPHKFCTVCTQCNPLVMGNLWPLRSLSRPVSTPC